MPPHPFDLLYGQHLGVLATHSCKEPGFPYGSVLPFCLDQTGQALILISDLAQHTRNLHANARASLTLHPAVAADQIQASARLVLLVEAEFLPAEAGEALAPRYYRYLPSSPDYRLLTDFKFVRLHLHKAHYIAGFGQIQWLEPPALLQPWPFSPEQENALCEDLNTREPILLAAVWHRITGAPPSEAVALTGIDPLGGDLRMGQDLLRFRFERPLQDLESAWHQLHQTQVRAG